MPQVRGLRGFLLFCAIGLTPIAVAASGKFHMVFLEAEIDGTGGVIGLNAPSHVTVSPDGKHVYVSSYSGNSVVVFERDGASGVLDFVQAQTDGSFGVDGLEAPYSVAVAPDGKHVYAASSGDNAVSVFERNSSTGALSFLEAKYDGVGGVNGLLGAVSVAVSPDGKHVYVAGYEDDAVAVFERNASTGLLNFVEAKVNGTGSVHWMNGPSSVSVSPDGNHLYVSGRLDDSVVVFERSALSGALAFAQVVRDGVGMVDGLSEAYDLTVSPDGKHVYVSGVGDSALAAFRRNKSTGGLSFLEAEFEGDAGVEGLAWGASLICSPDGSAVFVASVNSDAVAAFARTSSSGRLDFIEAVFDGAGGVDGLDGANAVAASPDGKHIYAAGSFDSGVAAFLVSYMRILNADPPECTEPAAAYSGVSTQEKAR
jgi:6-phosphogluconolactonase (cycloisomerase 2 family)